MRANQDLAALCPFPICGAKPSSSCIWIFWERREEWADQITRKHKRGIDYSQTCAFQQRKGIKGGNLTWAGERGDIRKCGFCLEVFAVEHLCGLEACVLTSSKHVPCMLGSPSVGDGED